MSLRQSQATVFSLIQTPSSHNRISRCYDFNYSRNQKDYYGDVDRQATNMIYKKQNIASQDRRQSSYYNSPKDNQSELMYKRNNGSLHNSRTTSQYGDSKNNLSSNHSSHTGRIQAELFKYQTPQKTQSIYSNIEHTSSFSDEWGKLNDDKRQQLFQEQDKESYKERITSYSTKHSRYGTSIKNENKNEDYYNQKEEKQVFSDYKSSNKKQLKLTNSPTKENEYVNIQSNTNQQRYNNLQSYNGYTSRSPTNYLQKQFVFESPMKDENRILRENYSKTLNLKLQSTYTRESSPQNRDTKISSKSLRATQSDKKDLSDDIEFYKNELQNYQNRLNSYQEQLRNTLDKNRIESFDALNSIKDEFISKKNNSSQLSYFNYQSQNQVDRYSVETESKLDKSEFNSKYVDNNSRLINKQQLFYQTQECTSCQPGGVDLFSSIKRDDTLYEQPPEKVLDVINLDLSVSNHFIKGENKRFEDNNSSKINPIQTKKQLSEYEKFSTCLPESSNGNTEKNNSENNNCFKNIDKYQNTCYMNKNENREEKQNVHKLVDDYSVYYKKRLTIDQFEFENKQRSHSSQVKSQNISTVPHALGQKLNILQDDSNIYILNNNNRKHHFQLSDQFNMQIDSVNKLSVDQKFNKERIQPNSLINNQDESSATGIYQSYSASKDLQKSTLDTSESIINNQQDKLKLIEQRYQRVEKITKKYSHLYKSKLLQTTSETKNPSQNISLQLTENKQDNSHTKNKNLHQYNTVNSMNNTPLYNTKRNSLLDSSMIPAVEQERTIKSMSLLPAQQIYLKRNSEDDINMLITETPRFQVDNDIEYFSSAQEILSLNLQQNMINQDYNQLERIEETLQNLSLNTMEEEENTQTFRQNQQFPSISCL